MVCAIAGSLAAGYLWAVAFGHGIPGLKGTEALAKATSFPDANVAFLAALGVYGASPMAAGIARGWLTTAALGGWLAITALIGAAVFALTRLLS